MKRSSATAVTSAPATGGWRNFAIPALAVIACFLGGATEKWAEGIVVALLGLLLLLDPPRVSLGRWTNGILLALVGWAAVGLLPARLFATPSWRTALIDDFGLQLPATISPQPWITLGCLLSLIAGVSWLYHVTAQDVELRGARVQLRVFAAGIVFLALSALLLHRMHSALPFWHNQRGFGPFPNRNQTGNLFGLTSIIILACVHDDIRKGKLRWIAWLIGLAILITALVVNFSRAGIGILIAGGAAWAIAFALRKRSAAGIALGLSLFLALLTVMLLFGGQTLERFHLRTGESDIVSGDFRWLIFRDAFELISTAPWSGIGLGNFDALFAIFRSASQSGNRALHPESDWLWMAAELGWPAVVLALIAAVLFIRAVFPLQEGTNQRFRLAALIGAVLFGLHGLVDVGGHRIGTAYSGLFLLALAARRPGAWAASRSLPVVFRVLGITLMTTGVAWAVAVRYDLALPGAIGAENAKRAATFASRGRDYSEAIRRANAALQWAPLDWQLYFIRALAEVGAKQPNDVALNDFRRARFLEPNAFEVPYEEGKVWLPRESTLAITAWREALRRAGERRVEVFSNMLELATQQNPTVAAQLEEFGRVHQDFALISLSRLSLAAFTAGVDRLLEADPGLERLSDGQKAALFKLWDERGEPEHLSRTVEAHPEWLMWAWRGMGRNYASKHDYRRAFELIEKWAPPAPMPAVSHGQTVEQLKRDAYSGSNNYGAGFALYSEQMREHQTDEAIATIRHFTEQGRCPAYFHYLEAKAWAAKENWDRAWTAWLAFEAAEKK